MSDSSRSKQQRETKRLENDMARLGQIVTGRYELIELLGHGGMGAVFKARHIAMDRIVAMKFLLPDVAEDPVMRDRFFREAKSSGKINHPNVVQLIDYGEGPEGDAYIVIEYLDGIGFDQEMKKFRQIEYNRAVKIFDQICAGVGMAHAKGIIHRDLKPSNIMLVHEHGERDFVKIVDFGLAKALDPDQESQRLTQTGEVFGSPIYMSPEQCMGQLLGPGSDIYALGVIMYESLMGRAPFVGAHMGETIARHLQDIPKPFAELRPDLEIPAALETVVMKALCKSAEDRQASMQEVKDELADALLPRLQARKRATAASAGGENAGDNTVRFNAEGTVKLDAATPPLPASPTPSGTVRSPAATGRISPAPTSARSKQVSAPPPAVRSPWMALSAIGALVLLACSAIYYATIYLPSTAISRSTPVKNQSHSTSQNSSTQESTNSASSSVQASTTSAANSESSSKNAATGNQQIISSTKSSSSEIQSPAKGHLKASSADISDKDSPDGSTERKAARAHKQQARKERHKEAAGLHGRQQEDPLAEQDPLVSSSSHKHHHDFQDYSYNYEKKDAYTHSWSVPLAGSNSGRGQ